MLVYTFIDGIEPNTKILLNFSAGGQASEMTYDELHALLNYIIQRNPECNGESSRLAIQK